MEQHIATTHPKARLRRAILRGGFAFFLAKGCLWLAAAAFLHERL